MVEIEEKFFYCGVKEMTGLSIYKVSKKNATFYYKMLHFSFLCVDKEGAFYKTGGTFPSTGV